MSLLQLRSRIVQNVIIATFSLFPSLVFVADRVMTARYTAMIVHALTVYNYAYRPYGTFLRCEQDPAFHLCSRFFASEHTFAMAGLSLLATIATLLIYATITKQKRFALSLALLLAGYILFFNSIQIITPFAQYYVIQIGD